MITKSQMAEEFVLDLIEQEWGIGYGDYNFLHDSNLFNKIWLEYLYLVAPQVAICMDPKIIDATIKAKPIKKLIKNIKNKKGSFCKI